MGAGAVWNVRLAQGADSDIERKFALTVTMMVSAGSVDAARLTEAVARQLADLQCNIAAVTAARLMQLHVTTLVFGMPAETSPARVHEVLARLRDRFDCSYALTTCSELGSAAERPLGHFTVRVQGGGRRRGVLADVAAALADNDVDILHVDHAARSLRIRVTVAGHQPGGDVQQIAEVEARIRLIMRQLASRLRLKIRVIPADPESQAQPDR